MKIDNFNNLSLEEKKEMLIKLKKDIKFCDVAGLCIGINSIFIEGFTIIEGYQNYVSSGNVLEGDFDLKINGLILALCLLTYLEAGLESEKLYNKSLALKKDINES